VKLRTTIPLLGALSLHAVVGRAEVHAVVLVAGLEVADVRGLAVKLHGLVAALPGNPPGRRPLADAPCGFMGGTAGLAAEAAVVVARPIAPVALTCEVPKGGVGHAYFGAHPVGGVEIALPIPSRVTWAGLQSHGHGNGENQQQ